MFYECFCFYTEVICPALTAPMNGAISFSPEISPTDYQTTVTYSCVNGFGLSGGDIGRTCVSSNAGPGEWSGTAPSCQGTNTFMFLFLTVVCAKKFFCPLL